MKNGRKDAMKRINLVQMKVKEKGKIVQIEGGANIEKRLSNMGIAVNKPVEKLSGFMLRGPVAIKVNRSIVALGYGTASKIWVELIKK